MAISVGTPILGANTSLATTFTISLGTVSVGQTMVVFVASGNGDISTLVDSLGNTYTLAQTFTWYCWNKAYVSSITTGGTSTLTVTLAVASHACGTAYPITGLVTSSATDQTNGDHSVSSTAAPTISTLATTSQASEVVFGAFSCFLGSGTNTFTAGSGYTATNNNSTPTSGQTICLGSEYQVISATGTQTANGSWGFAAQSDLCVVTLKGLVSAAAANGGFLRFMAR